MVSRSKRIVDKPFFGLARRRAHDVELSVAELIAPEDLGVFRIGDGRSIEPPRQG